MMAGDVGQVDHDLETPSIRKPQGKVPMVVVAFKLYHLRHVKRKPYVFHELAPLLLSGMSRENRFSLHANCAILHQKFRKGHRNEYYCSQ
jgi:hypothetical protein